MINLYKKSPLWFSLFWIFLYVGIMNIAMQFCGGFDNLQEKTTTQLLIPTCCSLLFAAIFTCWIFRNGLCKTFGLYRFHGRLSTFLYFIPLLLISCVNLQNGLALSAPLTVSLLMAANLALGGYIEEVIFRGFLFRAMEKDNLHSAVIVSAVTFGAGHIVNLANTSDTLGVLLQVAYAIAIGFLFTIIVYKGGSLWPCIASHMFVNATSVFAPEEGPFSHLIALLFGWVTPSLTQLCSALLLIFLSGGYALWLWKKA